MPTKSPNRASMHGPSRQTRRVPRQDVAESTQYWLRSFARAQDDVKNFAAEKDSKRLDTPIHDRPDDEDNQNQPQAATRVIAPTRTVRIQRQTAQQRQHNDD